MAEKVLITPELVEAAADMWKRGGMSKGSINSASALLSQFNTIDQVRAFNQLDSEWLRHSEKLNPEDQSKLLERLEKLEQKGSISDVTDFLGERSPSGFELGIARIQLGIKKSKPESGYRVRRGDTLGGIASIAGIGLVDLLKFNPGIKDPNSIFVGQEIKFK